MVEKDFTDVELAQMFEHSKDDKAAFAGSDVRILLGMINRLRQALKAKDGSA